MNEHHVFLTPSELERLTRGVTVVRQTDAAEAPIAATITIYPPRADAK